jgi:chromosomal replication initiation ATPase DnaA
MITIEEYADRTGIPAERLMERTRKAEIVMFRQVYWSYLSEHRVGVMEMGRMFGRNHATVIHGIGRVMDLMDVGDLCVKKCLKILFE